MAILTYFFFGWAGLRLGRSLVSYFFNGNFCSYLVITLTTPSYLFLFTSVAPQTPDSLHSTLPLHRCTFFTESFSLFVHIFLFENNKMKNGVPGDGQLQLVHIAGQPEPDHGRVRGGCQSHRRPRPHKKGGELAR